MVVMGSNTHIIHRDCQSLMKALVSALVCADDEAAEPKEQSQQEQTKKR